MASKSAMLVSPTAPNPIRTLDDNDFGGRSPSRLRQRGSQRWRDAVKSDGEANAQCLVQNGEGPSKRGEDEHRGMPLFLWGSWNIL